MENVVLRFALLGGTMLGWPAFAAAQDIQDTASQDGGAVAAASTNIDALDSATEIVVTGSSIRGVAPVGSSLTTISRDEIVSTGATTTTELLRSVPQLGSFNNIGIGTGADQSAITDQPAIHGIGVGNAGGSLTLTLVDGFRLPGAGINSTAPDAGAVPPSAIERVEVVADGASSIYGSDAVAGVVNLILRRQFDGMESSGRVGFGSSYRTYNLSQIAGKTWSTGSVYLDYEFSKNTNINGRDRKYWNSYQPIHGRDDRSTNCAPSNVTVDGNIYNLSSGAATAGALLCDNNKANDLYPEQQRHQVIGYARQELSDNVELHVRSLYSARNVNSLQAISGNYVSSSALGVTVTQGAAYDYAVSNGIPAGTHEVAWS